MTEEERLKTAVLKPSPKPSASDAVARAAFRVIVGGLISLIAALASQMVVAAIFGAGAEMDAFLSALVVPLYLWTVLVSGLPFVLIPAFVREEAKGHEEDAWALVGSFFWLMGGILVIVAIVGSSLARQIIDLSAPGLVPPKADLAARMLAILMFTVPLTGLGSLAEGIQNTRNSFFWPSVARGIGSLGNVAMVLILYQKAGPISLAWGNLVSAGLVACVPIVPVMRHGWTKLIPLSDSRVIEMLRLMAPFLLFGLFSRSTLVFERYFASRLPDGDLSYLGYANKISSIAVTLLATAIAAAIFPAMARAYAERREEGLVERSGHGLRLTLATALPVVSVVGAIAVPLVTVLYERGAFEHSDTLNVGRIVFIVLIGDVLFRMLSNTASRTLFVIKDTLTMPIAGAITASLYVLMGKAFVDWWGYSGLALGRSLQAGLAVVIVFSVLVRRLRTFHLRRLAGHILLYAVASLLAALSAWLITWALPVLPALPQLLAASCVAAPIYFAILYLGDRDIALSVLETVGVRQIIRITLAWLRQLSTAYRKAISQRID